MFPFDDVIHETKRRELGTWDVHTYVVDSYVSFVIIIQAITTHKAKNDIRPLFV